MTGQELIEWAVQECLKYRLPPTDANILMCIRRWRPKVEYDSIPQAKLE